MLGRSLGLMLAVLLLGAGAVFTFQGLGYIKGSSMTGDHTWATIGPVLAGLGVALGYVVVRRRRT